MDYIIRSKSGVIHSKYLEEGAGEKLGQELMEEDDDEVEY